MNSNPKQNQRILAYMQQYGSITQLEALTELGVMRLASRISDLKRKGFSIIGKTVSVKNRFNEVCRIKKYALETCEEIKGEIL